jgi:hypothetical protein
MISTPTQAAHAAFGDLARVTNRKPTDRSGQRSETVMSAALMESEASPYFSVL